MALDASATGAQDLANAIESGALTGALLSRAKDILAALDRPVRLALLGLPGSGKTTLLNLLAGATVVPAGLKLPSMHLVHSARPRVDCTLPDGSTQSFDGLNLADVARLSPVFVTVALPLPALAKVSMLEVVAGAEPEQQARALTWAAKRCDIALWCSDQGFSGEEPDVWDYAPDAMQDHAFMVLTKADRYDDIDLQVRNLTSQHGAFFKRVLSVDTIAAIRARRQDGSVDKDLLRQSGGMALISSILKDVDAGRQVAQDQADVFLRQIDYTPVTAGPALDTQPTEPVAAPVLTVPQTIVEQVSLDPASRAACEAAVVQLMAQGAALADATSQGTVDGEDIVAACVDTVGWLSDHMASEGSDDNSSMQELRDAAMDASDLMQLIELETGDTVTADALALMVQLRDELQAKLAA